MMMIDEERRDERKGDQSPSMHRCSGSSYLKI